MYADIEEQSISFHLRDVSSHSVLSDPLILNRRYQWCHIETYCNRQRSCVTLYSVCHAQIASSTSASVQNSSSLPLLWLLDSHTHSNTIILSILQILERKCIENKERKLSFLIDVLLIYLRFFIYLSCDKDNKKHPMYKMSLNRISA